MCHISFVLYVEMQERLGRWGEHGGGDFSRAQLWLLCSSVASTWYIAAASLHVK